MAIRAGAQQVPRKREVHLGAFFAPPRVRFAASMRVERGLRYTATESVIRTKRRIRPASCGAPAKGLRHLPAEVQRPVAPAIGRCAAPHRFRSTTAPENSRSTVNAD